MLLRFLFDRVKRLDNGNKRYYINYRFGIEKDNKLKSYSNDYELMFVDINRMFAEDIGVTYLMIFHTDKKGNRRKNLLELTL